MADQHKQAAEVTVASMTETGAAQKFVQRYWLPAAIVALAVTGALLFMQHSKNSAVRDSKQQWTKFDEAVQFGPAGFPGGAPGELANLADQESGTAPGQFARIASVLNYMRAGQWQDAEQAAAKLEATGILDADGLAALSGTAKSSKAWFDANKQMFSNPELEGGAPRVRIETSAGNVVVGLYESKAPKHVENFLKLCEEGYYDGIAFHRVVPGFMVQTGDPNSKTDDFDTWGQGGPDEKIEAEPNGLMHFAGVLAAAKNPSETDSSGSQFYLTVDEAHHLNGQHTVFGVVLKGQEIADKMADAARVEGTERPVEPVRITGTVKL